MSKIINWLLVLSLIFILFGCNLPERQAYSEARKACRAPELSTSEITLLVNDYVYDLNNARANYKSDPEKITNNFVNKYFDNDSIVIRSHYDMSSSGDKEIYKMYFDGLNQLSTHIESIISINNISPLGCGYYSILGEYKTTDIQTNKSFDSSAIFIIKYKGGLYGSKWYVYREISNIDEDDVK